MSDLPKKEEEKLPFVDTNDNSILPFVRSEEDLKNKRELVLSKIQGSINKEDIKYVKDNLKDLIETGSSVISTLVTIAEESQSARAFEVLGNFLKTIADINKDIIEVNRVTTELNLKIVENNGDNVKNTTNNAFFVGTNSELNKLLDKLTNKNQDSIIEGDFEHG